MRSDLSVFRNVGFIALLITIVCRWSMAAPPSESEPAIPSQIERERPPLTLASTKKVLFDFVRTLRPLVSGSEYEGWVIFTSEIYRSGVEVFLYEDHYRGDGKAIEGLSASQIIANLNRCQKMWEQERDPLAKRVDWTVLGQKWKRVYHLIRKLIIRIRVIEIDQQYQLMEKEYAKFKEDFDRKHGWLPQIQTEGSKKKPSSQVAVPKSNLQVSPLSLPPVKGAISLQEDPKVQEQACEAHQHTRLLRMKMSKKTERPILLR